MGDDENYCSTIVRYEQAIIDRWGAALRRGIGWHEELMSASAYLELPSTRSHQREIELEEEEKARIRAERHAKNQRRYYARHKEECLERSRDWKRRNRKGGRHERRRDPRY